MKGYPLAKINFKRFKKYENIIFDLDGTLIDSKTSILNAIKKALRENNLNISEKKFEIGPPLDEALQKLCEGFEYKIKEIKSSFIDIYDSISYNQIRKIEGADDFLMYLINNNKKVFILTNKRTKIAKKIWSEFFSDFKTVPVIGIDNYGHNIENKSLLMKKFLSDFDLNSKKSIYLGDTNNDFFVAKNNYLDFIKIIS